MYIMKINTYMYSAAIDETKIDVGDLWAKTLYMGTHSVMSY